MTSVPSPRPTSPRARIGGRDHVVTHRRRNVLDLTYGDDQAASDDSRCLMASPRGLTFWTSGTSATTTSSTRTTGYQACFEGTHRSADDRSICAALKR